MKYNSGLSAFISPEGGRVSPTCILEAFTNDYDRHFGRQNTQITAEIRRFMIEQYFFQHPNFNYLMQNADCLYMLFGQRNQTWNKCLGETAIINQNKENDSHLIPLGYALVIKDICNLTNQQYSTIEWIETFYPSHNLMSLLLDKLETQFDLLPIPRDTQFNCSFWEHYEKTTNRISSNYRQMMNKYDVHQFIEANHFDWSLKLTNIVSNHINNNYDDDSYDSDDK
jgi:hypothetical protein